MALKVSKVINIWVAILFEASPGFGVELLLTRKVASVDRSQSSLKRVLVSE